MYFYKFHIGDFAMWTAGFDSESVGIFIKLLNRYMLTENPIKTDWVFLGFQNSEQEKAKAILSSCWEETPDGWVFPPVLEIVKHYQSSSAKNRENGKKGGRPRKANSNPEETQTKPSGFSEETQTKPNTKPNSVNSINSVNSVNKDIDTHPSPSARTASVSSKRLPSIQKPDGVEDDDWQAYLRLRKQKRLPLTQRALDSMLAEANKVNLTPQQMIVCCLERSWASFRSEWYEKEQSEKPFDFDKWAAEHPELFDDTRDGVKA